MCDDILNRRGLHAQTCGSGGDRTRRHHAVRNRFCPFAQAARLQTELEKANLLPPSSDQVHAERRRPADVFVSSWQNGLPAAFDFAICSPVRHDVVVQASSKPGAAAEAYEQHKRMYLDTAAQCLRQGFSFVPMVGEPSGGWGPSAQCVFKQLSEAIAAASGRDSRIELLEHRQAMGILLRLANARAIFRRHPGSTPVHDDPISSALLVLGA